MDTHFLLSHWIRGAANAILPTFHPQEFLQAVETIKPTKLNLVPTMIVMLLSQFPLADASYLIPAVLNSNFLFLRALILLAEDYISL